MSLAPTFVLGPESGGRGYRILASSSGQVSGSWTIDLPMVLLNWGQLEREESFAAQLPLEDGGALVCRGKFFRRVALGPVAWLHAVHLAPELLEETFERTEQLLALIPEPDETLAFADAPLELASLPPPRRALWAGLNLAWTDRAIAVDPSVDLEAVLGAALASVDPPEQRRRVSGWATTAELPARGAISPLRQCRLIVARPGIELAEAGFLPASVNADGVPETPEGGEPPIGRHVWERLHAILRDGPAFAPAADSEQLAWRYVMSEQAPDKLVGRLLRNATKLLAPTSMATLLGKLAHLEDDALREPALEVLDQYFALLAETGHAAAPAAALLAEGDAGEFAQIVLPRLDDNALKALPGDDFASLVQVTIGIVRDRLGTAPAVVVDALARIAGELAYRCENQRYPVDPLLEIVHFWPDESTGKLRGLLTRKLLGRIADGGRSTLAGVTRKLLPARHLEAAARDQRVAALLLHFVALRRLELAHG